MAAVDCITIFEVAAFVIAMLFVSTVALDMCGPLLTIATTMLALSDGASLFRHEYKVSV